jgi:hypothetical protein
MGMQYDVWAVTPATAADDNFYVESVTPSEAGALTLANTTPSVNGCGYKVVLTTAGDESGVNFTIVGIGVNGLPITETFAGPSSATTVTTTNYFASVSSISVSGATGGAIILGYSLDFALPRTRIKGFYFTGAANAGSVVVTRVRGSKVLLNLATPAGTGTSGSFYMAAEGILVGAALNDFATVTRTSVASTTFICG